MSISGDILDVLLISTQGHGQITKFQDDIMTMSALKSILAVLNAPNITQWLIWPWAEALGDSLKLMQFC